MKYQDILVLLRLNGTFFVIKDIVAGEYSDDELQESCEYKYNEHSCPTNYIPVEMICDAGDCDPHGIFVFVRAIWLTKEYIEAESLGKKNEYLKKVFPEIE